MRGMVSIGREKPQHHSGLPCGLIPGDTRAAVGCSVLARLSETATRPGKPQPQS